MILNLPACTACALQKNQTVIDNFGMTKQKTCDPYQSCDPLEICVYFSATHPLLLVFPSILQTYSGLFLGQCVQMPPEDSSQV